MSPSSMSSSMSPLLMSWVVNVNLYNARTFSFSLVTLLYSFIIVIAYYCTSIYYRNLTNWNVISTAQWIITELVLRLLTKYWDFDPNKNFCCRMMIIETCRGGSICEEIMCLAYRSTPYYSSFYCYIFLQ